MHDLLNRLFRGGGASPRQETNGGAERVQRRSSGLQELTRSLKSGDSLSVLDLGPTSAANITHFTSLGHRTYTEDVLLASREPSLIVHREEGDTLDIERFLSENLKFDREIFDGVLCWDVFDYLHADLVKPVVQRLHYAMKPGSLLLGFFHTKDAGPEAPYHRYHIAGADMLDMQRVYAPPNRKEGEGRNPWFRLQRVFNNRHIENLFHDFGSIKFFLGRDNIREVLVVR